MLLQQPHRLLHGALELWIAPADDVLRPVLHVDIRCDALVLNGPPPIAREETTPRRDHRATINERRRVSRVHEAAPRALADEWSDLATLEHVRHQVATRSRHFVDNHHLRSPDPRRRTRKRKALTRHVVEVTIKVALKHLDNIVSRRSAAIETLVNDDAFLVLLREVVPIETRVTRLTGVRQVDVRELTIGKLLNETTVRLDPRAGAQRLFTRNGQDRDCTRALHRRRGIHR